MKKTLTFLGTMALAVFLSLALVVGIKTVRAQQPTVKAFQIWAHAVEPDLTTGQLSIVESYLARRSDGVESHPSKLAFGHFSVVGEQGWRKLR
jgi:hypothetical protein